MKKLVLIILLSVGSTILWATDGCWTYLEDGSFYIEYESSERLWCAFRDFTDETILIGESQIPIAWDTESHKLTVRMTNRITVFEIYDGCYYSWFVVMKE